MGKNILLVIEDLHLGNAIARHFRLSRNGGSTVVVANSRQLALQAIDSEQTGFDLIVTDPIDLPGFKNFVESIRAKSPPNTKVVLYSDDGRTDPLGSFAEATVSKLNENSIRSLVDVAKQLLAAAA